jgi:N-dimethylarginine dimethylaminohydrolase
MQAGREPSSVDRLDEAVSARPASRPLSEFAAPPVRMLVHDSARTGAFATLARRDGRESSQRYLFRAVPDQHVFSREHASLVASLREAGVVAVELAELVAESDRRRLDGNPNYVYTRDPVITLPWLPGWFIRGAMRKSIRRSEPGVLARALAALGLRELFAMPSNAFLEGGDVIPLVRHGRRTLLVGFGPRTSYVALAELRRRLLPSTVDEVVAIELVPERMNLDGALVPVANDTVLLEPSSIVRSFVLDGDGERVVDVRAYLQEAGMSAIDVSRDEATTAQACNVICLGGRRVVCYDLCPRVVTALRARKIEVRTIPAAELIKGTGGPRCMTRPLYC